jgi:hypothetical protein
MKKIGLAILIVASFGATGRARRKTPPLLFHAAHCLAVKQFLPRTKASKFTFGYILDQHSWPGEKVIYVVLYAAPARSSGWVFEVFLSAKDRREILNIQNNAKFVLSRRAGSGVSFVNPPLGGIWTQAHLVSAIKEIEKQPRFVIPIKNLYATDSYNCESYTDPQRPMK